MYNANIFLSNMLIVSNQEFRSGVGKLFGGKAASLYYELSKGCIL